MDEGWFAIIGAAVGGLVGVMGTLRATLIQQRGEDRRANRPELKELVVSFSTAAQNAWDAELKMERAYEDIESGAVVGYTELRKAGAHWSNAQQAAWDQLTLLRITHAGLAEPAEALLLTCRLFTDPDAVQPSPPKDEVLTRHMTAREAFEQAARKVLRVD